MQDYLNLVSDLPDSVTRQIEKDLSRTTASSLTQPTLKVSSAPLILEEME